MRTLAGDGERCSSTRPARNCGVPRVEGDPRVDGDGTKPSKERRRAIDCVGDTRGELVLGVDGIDGDCVRGAARFERRLRNLIRLIVTSQKTEGRTILPEDNRSFFPLLFLTKHATVYRPLPTALSKVSRRRTDVCLQHHSLRSGMRAVHGENAECKHSLFRLSHRTATKDLQRLMQSPFANLRNVDCHGVCAGVDVATLSPSSVIHAEQEVHSSGGSRRQLSAARTSSTVRVGFTGSAAAFVRR